MVRTALFLTITTLVASAQTNTMKCEAGKCSSAKATLPKTAVTSAEPTAAPRKRNPSQPTIKQLFNVRTVRVVHQSIAPQTVNYGYVVSADDRRVEVVPRFNGYVVKLFADTRYLKVRKGDALARIYSPEVYKAKEDYRNALAFHAKHPSKKMVEGSRLKLELLGVNTREIAAIAPNRRVDAYTTIYAPSDGWIMRKAVEKGSAFQAGQTLFEIVDLSRVWVEAKLYTDQLHQLVNLSRFTVQAAGVEGAFKAKKALLYPELDPKEATATLRLIVDNPDDTLKPGMYATITASSVPKTRPVVPRSAVIRKNGRWYAFLATEFEGEYMPVPIDVKPLDNTLYEVVSGLKEGDEVVQNALFMMDSDAQINGIY